MKSPILLITTILGGLGMGTVHAQGNDAEGPVRAVLESINTAVAACKIDEYARHWSDGGSIFISSGDPLMPAAQYLDIWRQVCAGGGGFSAFEPGDQHIEVLGRTALVTGTIGYSFTDPDGETHSGTTRFTTVLEHTDNEWKIVHAHGSELGLHAAKNAEPGQGKVHSNRGSMLNADRHF